MQGALIFTIIFIALIVFAVAIPAVIRSVGGGAGDGLFSFSGNAALLKSTDGGVAWKDVGSSFVRGDVLFIMSHPSDSDMVFIALRGRGLFKSEDRGETFALVLGDGLSAQTTVYDMYFGEYRGSQALYVAAFQNGIGMLLVSTDLEQFRRLYLAPLSNVAVFASAQDPIDKRLFVGTAQGGLLESVNDGESWRLVRWFPGPIVLLKVNPHTGVLLAYSDQNRLFRSADKGETWIEVTNELADRSQEGQELTTIAFHPTEALNVYAGSRLGLLHSSDGGATFILVRTTVPPESLPVQDIEFDGLRPEVLYISAGTQLHISEDRGVTWRSVQIPSRRAVSHLIIDQTNSNNMYAVTQ